MSRIIVTYYKRQECEIHTMLYYWEGFVNDLKQAGNDVWVLNTAYVNPWEYNTPSDPQLDGMLLASAKAFDPQLIITFNHRIPQAFLDTFDVPIILWDGDNLGAFCGQIYLKQHLSRYQVFSITKDWRKDYMDFGFAPEQYHYVPNATSVTPMDVPQTMNISFLGARSFFNYSLVKQMEKNNRLDVCRQVVEESLRTNNFDPAYFRQKYFADDPAVTEETVYPLMGYRWLTMAQVMDMGLTICGREARWNMLAPFMPQVLSMFNPRQVWSLEENNLFYNQSKLSLCPMHPQGRGSAYAWRALDVMASNACLIPSTATELAELTRDYVELPFFASPYDVRGICRDLLDNEDRRRAIVEGSHAYIQAHGLWKHRFADAQQIMGIPLVNPGEAGSVVNPYFDDPAIRAYVGEAAEADKARQTALKVSVGSGADQQVLEKVAKYATAEANRVFETRRRFNEDQNKRLIRSAVDEAERTRDKQRQQELAQTRQLVRAAVDEAERARDKQHQQRVTQQAERLLAEYRRQEETRRQQEAARRPIARLKRAVRRCLHLLKKPFRAKDPADKSE